MNDAFYAANEDSDLISVELVIALFDYDPESGEFIRKITTGTKAKKGSIAGIADEKGHIIITVNGSKYYAHRLAWAIYYNEFPPKRLDHIDRNPSNNAIDNLRLATVLENSRNIGVRSDNTTGYKGVSLDKRSNRYRANINFNNKQKSLGYYSTAEEAALAYNKAAKELFGEFAYENIIRS